MVAPSFEAPGEGAFATVSCSVDGNVEIGFDGFNDDGGLAWKRNLDAAAFSRAATAAIDVGKIDIDRTHILARPTEGELQAPLGMLAESFGQCEATGLDLDTHDALLVSET